MRRIGWLLLPLGLAACSNVQWSKDGTSPKMAAEDYADCQSEAKEATRRDNNIDADILASRGPDWQHSGTLREHEAAMASDTGRQSGDLVKSCMIGKGYAPGA